MKHIKPGRGPSAMGACRRHHRRRFSASSGPYRSRLHRGAPAFFRLFGVLFVIIGIVQAVYSFKNATGKNRYSSFDIVDSAGGAGPLGSAVRRRCRIRRCSGTSRQLGAELRYCPYCGAEAGEGFAFCAKCGRKLPDIP